MVCFILHKCSFPSCSSLKVSPSDVTTFLRQNIHTPFPRTTKNTHRGNHHLSQQLQHSVSRFKKFWRSGAAKLPLRLFCLFALTNTLREIQDASVCVRVCVCARWSKNASPKPTSCPALSMKTIMVAARRITQKEQLLKRQHPCCFHLDTDRSN